jgi:Na+/melibiose symporter-like transporter
MKTNTFILIVMAYTSLLGLPSIFAPAMSIEYFAGDPTDVNQLSLMNFVGAYQLAIGFLGYVAYRSADKATRRGWLMSIAFLTIAAIIIFVYNINARMMPVHKTYMIDLCIWAILALGSLYFWNKEK